MLPVAQSGGVIAGARMFDPLTVIEVTDPVVAEEVTVNELDALVRVAGGRVSWSEVRIGAITSRDTP
jgi:hypothetical protein